MSSSQQQSTNFNNNNNTNNNNQPQNTQPPPQIPANPQFNDYEFDPSISTFYNSPAYYDPSSFVIGNGDYQSTELVCYTDDGYEELPNEVAAELYAREEMLRNEQFNDNDANEDDTNYSETIDNAFANYENEYSKYWKHTDSTWIDFSHDEQEEMFDQMRECMNFMSDEYATAEMPYNLVESTQVSTLNPDAVEFQPPWSTFIPSTDKESIVVTSWTPCQAKKQEEEEEEEEQENDF